VLEHGEMQWDVSDAEVALAVYDDDIPTSPYELMEQQLVRVLELPPAEEAAAPPVAPTAVRAKPYASAASSHNSSWLRASEAGASGDVQGGARYAIPALDLEVAARRRCLREAKAREAKAKAERAAAVRDRDDHSTSSGP
jgi:hypothetical protein